MFPSNNRNVPMSLLFMSGMVIVCTLGNCGKKTTEAPSPTLVASVSPAGASSLTTTQSLTFSLSVSPGESGQTIESIKSGIILYTIDGTTPTVDSLKLDLDLTNPTTSNGATVYRTTTALSIAATKTVKYYGLLTLDHETSKKSMTGQVKKNSEDLVAISTTNSETYTFTSSSSTTGSSSSTSTTGSTTSDFVSGQNASIVIGQADFTSNSFGSTATTLKNPTSVAVTSAGYLYITDKSNHRIQGYSSVPTSNGAAASFAIGSTSPSTTLGSSTTANRLSSPMYAFSTGTQLFVADSVNCRVLIYNSPTTTYTSANLAFGDSDTTTNVCHNAALSTWLGNPKGLSVGGSKVAIADTSLSRVLLFNSIPTANQPTADIVLGQTTMNTGASGSGATMNNPLGVWTNGTKVVVSDTSNNRVMIWNTWPTSNGQTPDLFLGQTSSAGNGSNYGGLSASSLYSPQGAYSDGTRLVVADTNNSRVLMWKTWPTSNNQAADVVFGQTSFTAADSSGTASAALLAAPTGVYYDGTKVYVADTGNQRVLIYEKQ